MMRARFLGGVLALIALLGWASVSAAQPMNFRVPVLMGVRVTPQGGAGGGGGGGSPPSYLWANAGTISTSSTTVNTSKASNSIASGDLLMIFITMTDNSGTNHSLQCPSGGWTALSWSPTYNGGGGHNQMGCWKIAGGSETGIYAPTWSTGNSQASQWTLVDFGGANASSPIEDTAMTAAGSTSVTTPTVTSAGANRLWVSCVGAVGSSIAFSAAPATQQFTSSTGALVKFSCSTSTVNSGATGTAAWTLSQGNPSFGISFLIKP